MNLNENFENTILNKGGSHVGEKKVDEKGGYMGYKELGGIISEQDYRHALAKAAGVAALDKKQIMAPLKTPGEQKALEEAMGQAVHFAQGAGIPINNSEGSFDPKIVLYGILRNDGSPVKEHPHGKLGDQQLFAEVLRMLGDEKSREDFIEANRIAFRHE